MKKLLEISAITATVLSANPAEDIAKEAVNTAADAAKTAVVEKANEVIAPTKKETATSDANKTEEKKK